jgi:dTDP-4-amino-4,6-dideoxygalactose transaminase
VVDLRRRMQAMRDELHEAIARVLVSGRLIDGAEVEAFEREFADFARRRFAVAVGSGTDALRLALSAAGVGAGHEVIVPAFTAVATAAAVCRTGARPVLVDVDPDTGALDSEAAAAAITPRTRAIVPVHLYGRPAHIPSLGVPVIDDAAHAHGALRGSVALATAYSFYPTKNLGGIGDGGAVLTDDADVAQRVRLLRAHGVTRHYRHEVVAGNSRLSEIEAAVLRIGLRLLPTGNARRRDIGRRYRAASPGMRWHPDHERHVMHLCVARVEDRTSFRAAMPFDTAVHYPLALTQQPAYASFARGPCPEAEQWAAECVSFPCFPEMVDVEVDQVCGALP